MANTGYKKYNNLLKVVNGGPNNGQPLDINNQLTSISGLVQDTKANTFGEPDYIPSTLDYTFCPVNIISNSIELRFNSTTTAICTSISEICYISGGVLNVGSEIFIDVNMTLIYTGSSTFVVNAAGGTVYNLTGNIVGSASVNTC